MAWYNWFFASRKKKRALPLSDGTDRSGVVMRQGGRAVTDPDMPQFHGSAADQIRGVRGSAMDRARFYLRSAFTPSQPVINYRMFAGRTQVLKTLIRSIEDQKLHVVLYGERGIGKTSLLHVLSQLARDARYVVRYASCGEETEFSDMFRSILADIPLLYHSDYDPTSKEIESGGTFADLLPAGNVGVPQISDLLSKISNTRVLVILDEFDRAHSSAFRRSIAEMIKNLSDRSVRVQLVIAGVAANLTELIEHIPSIRRNILGLRVPNMSNAEIEQMIQNGENVCGLKFDAQARSFITAVAYGSPYIASLLSQHAGLSAVDRSAVEVGRPDVVSAIGQVVEEIQHRVSASSHYQITRAHGDGHDVNLGLLARAALHSGGVLTPDQVAVILDKTEATALNYLKQLSTKYGLMETVPNDPAGAYRFVEEGVPVFLWVQLAQHRFSGWSDGEAELQAQLARYEPAQENAAE